MKLIFLAVLSWLLVFYTGLSFLAIITTIFFLDWVVCVMFKHEVSEEQHLLDSLLHDTSEILWEKFDGDDKKFARYAKSAYDSIFNHNSEFKKNVCVFFPIGRVTAANTFNGCFVKGKEGLPVYKKVPKASCFGDNLFLGKVQKTLYKYYEGRCDGIIVATFEVWKYWSNNVQVFPPPDFGRYDPVTTFPPPLNTIDSEEVISRKLRSGKIY